MPGEVCPVTVALVALVLLHVRVAELPTTMEAGETEIAAVGAGKTVAVAVAVAVRVPAAFVTVAVAVYVVVTVGLTLAVPLVLPPSAPGLIETLSAFALP